MTEPRTKAAEAEAVRAEARHARSKARLFSDDGDLQRLKRYADELDQRASELDRETTAEQAMPPAGPSAVYEQQQVQQQQANDAQRDQPGSEEKSE